MHWPPPRSTRHTTLFPYTPLFRSHRPGLFRLHEPVFRIVLLLGTVLRILPCARPAVPVHAVHDVLSKVQATAAAGAVSEGQIDLRDATQAALRHLADFDVPIAVAQADVHPGLLTMRTPIWCE